MARNIYHLEITAINADERITEHGYYTSLTALFEDNAEQLEVSLSTLQKANFPYTKKDYWIEWTIRKGVASTTTEVREYNQID